MIAFLMETKIPKHLLFMHNKYKEKIVILQLIGIIVIKSRETRAVIYTYRNSSGHLSKYRIFTCDSVPLRLMNQGKRVFIVHNS